MSLKDDPSGLLDENDLNDETVGLPPWKYFLNHESKLKTFSRIEGLEKSEEYMLEYPLLASEYAVNWVAIEALNLTIKDNDDKEMCVVAEQCILLQYLFDLAKSLRAEPTSTKMIKLFFKKLRAADPSYMKMFRDEVSSFQDRLRLKSKEQLDASVVQPLQQDKQQQTDETVEVVGKKGKRRGRKEKEGSSAEPTKTAAEKKEDLIANLISSLTRGIRAIDEKLDRINLIAQEAKSCTESDHMALLDEMYESDYYRMGYEQSLARFFQDADKLKHYGHPNSHLFYAKVCELRESIRYYRTSKDRRPRRDFYGPKEHTCRLCLDPWDRNYIDSADWEDCDI